MRTPSIVVFPLAILTAFALAQDDAPRDWPVHDMERPKPVVVTPGNANSDAPSDAIVLFGGGDLDAWQHNDGRDAEWSIVDGTIEVKRGTGDMRTRDGFGDCQLHLEWMIPEGIDGDGQHPGNSGVFLMNRYEVQILDSFENETYADGQAAAVYGWNPPLVNAMRPQGQWQTYDIVFRRPHFDESGACTRPATVTVLHNGVVVQDHFTLGGPTRHTRRDGYTAHRASEPIRLQDHGQPVRFRNIWIRHLEPTDP